MKHSESQALIAALLSRSNINDDARAAFAQCYPEAPREMIETATFHVCGDGIEAALTWVASIELFLRNPAERLSRSATWELLNHLYNWQQFQTLMPMGKQDVMGLLEDIKMHLDGNEPNAAKEAVDELIKSMSGDLAHPDIQ